MGLPAPDQAALMKVAETYGFNLAPAEINEYQPFVTRLLEAWNAVEEAYTAQAPEAPERAWSYPAANDNPHNAWYATTSITERADGPLAGKTVAIKDNTAVAGLPMTNGSNTMTGYIPAADATVVRRLLDAGATITGKAVCENLCFSGTSVTANTGPVTNPWDTTRSAGGSSSGSGALVAAGIADLAVSADQAGSIRMPASACGIVGHKPTWGLVPYTGGFPLEQTIDHLGPMARTVPDTARMLSVMAGPDGLDPRQPANPNMQDFFATLAEGANGLKVGVVQEGFGRPESEDAVDSTVRKAIDRLRDAGLAVSETSVPMHRIGKQVWDVIASEGTTSQMVDTYGYGLNSKGLYDPEIMEHYGNLWHADGSQFPPTVKLVLFAGKYGLRQTYGKHYAMARNLVPKLAASYDKALEEVDVLVMPTLPMKPARIADAMASTKSTLSMALEMLGNTAPFDITGHPVCSIPAGLSEGLPTGLMIIGRQFDDAMALRVAHAFEETAGGFPSPPSAS